MTDKPGVYDFAAIAQYAKQQEAEKMANIMGRPLEDAKPVEAPSDIDWGMYAPCGFALTTDEVMSALIAYDRMAHPLPEDWWT